MASSSSSSSFHSTPPSSSSSSSSSQSPKHDVFLSFRGSDTRNTFVDHLYSALDQQGIYTYKDDKTLPRGETIGPSLLKAIEESQIAVIVFSENYADSSWCLQELAHIMKCKDENSQIVIPVFYQIDPSELRKQKGKYGEALAKHELENKNIESWRKALADAGNLSGDVVNGPETIFIKQIVDTISNRLCMTISSENEDLIGIMARLQDLKSKIEMESDGVVIVGIWGLGGGGKTTLASALYHEISSKFDGCCFLKDVREESIKHGLEELQGKILSIILKQKREEVVGDVGSLIKSRFRRKKVLMVLDDVDHLDQLKELAGSNDWFGKGSRILITTRDYHLLKARKVNVIYNISLLNHNEAIKLFYKHAPRDDRPIEDYEMLSKEVVSYAGGLPLALKVLGSFLCDKDMSEWKSALARLKDIPETDIVEKLKISYDGLKPMEKELFLDIACFFRGEKKDEAMVILDACGFHPIIGVKLLIEKALITVSKTGFFDMHDLIQEMGQYIVRGGKPKNPEKHNRVWRTEDVVKICSMDATKKNDTITALQVRFRWYKEVPSNLPQVLGNMKKLRLISLEGYATTSLPREFQPTELCYLRLEKSLVEQLWEGYKYLPNLKVLNLAYSRKLIRTPDFDGLPYLERMTLKGCDNLREICPSIGYHERLIFVDMHRCRSLKMFPPIIRMKKLETLILSSCFQPRKFLDIQTNMDNLVSMKLGFSRSLIRLNLRDCNLVDGDISVLCELSNLQVLNLSRNKFSRLHSSLSQLSRLKFLDLSWCSKLVELPDLPSSIAVLLADWCNSLQIVGGLATNLKWLWKVSLLTYCARDDGMIIEQSILESMLQGNAVEDYFISLCFGITNISTRGFGWKTCLLELPSNWYNEFSGFLVYVSDFGDHTDEIVIEDANEDDILEVPDENEENSEPVGAMCYISFGSLRHTTWWNSTHSKISFCIENFYLKVELVPRRSEGDSTERLKDATNSSEFWDEESPNRNTFKILHDSKSTIGIGWSHDLRSDMFNSKGDIEKSLNFENLLKSQNDEREMLFNVFHQ